MDHFLAVRETIKENTVGLQLPYGLHYAVELFSKSHIYYRTYKFAKYNHEANKNPHKGNPAVYGAALQLFGDHTQIGSYAINLALVTKCTLDLLREYRLLSDEYQTFRKTYHWQYPVYQPIKYADPNAQQIISPSLTRLIQVRISGFAKQQLKVSQCALKVFWQTFKLSMCLCDAHLLFNNDTQARYEACTEMVAEWDKYQTQLKENKDKLLEELQKRSTLADKILTRLGIAKTSAFVLENLKKNNNPLVQAADKAVDEVKAVGQETADTFYVKGKIIPLHINLAQGNALPPPLPPGRFAPWAGQTIAIISANSAKDSFNTNVSILDNISRPIIDESLKRLSWLALCVADFFNTNKMPKEEIISPFI